MKAIWKGRVVAESDATVVVEGNHYFPPDSLVRDHFRDSEETSVCGWKGTARYFDLVVGEDVNPACAWSYPEPTEAAGNIRGHVAFWKGVDVTS